MAFDLHPIICTCMDVVTTCIPVTVFFPLWVWLCSKHQHEVKSSRNQTTMVWRTFVWTDRGHDRPHLPLHMHTGYLVYHYTESEQLAMIATCLSVWHFNTTYFSVSRTNTCSLRFNVLGKHSSNWHSFSCTSSFFCGIPLYLLCLSMLSPTSLSWGVRRKSWHTSCCHSVTT